jgi:estrone sulfotransferase
LQEDVVNVMSKINQVPAGEARFMRRGEVGDWKNQLTGDQLERIRDWEQRQLANTGLTFQYS